MSATVIKYKSRTFTVTRTQLVAEPSARFVECARDGAEIARAIFAELDQDREHFVLLALNTKHRVIGHKVLFSGTVDAASVFPRDVLLAALRLEAVALVIVHNHPSGDPNPSAADKLLTRDIKAACKMVEIQLLDHIVLGAGSERFSFAEADMLYTSTSTFTATN